MPAPILIKAVIWTNALLYLLSLALSGKAVGFSLNPLFALSPAPGIVRFLGATGTDPIGHFNDWWSLLTASWYHGSLLHILFNMMALRTVAPLVIQAFGRARMFSIYALAGAGGFFVSYLGQVSLTLGASSGICGLIGALLYYGKSRGGEWGQLVFRQTKAWIFSLALFGFILPNIDNWGHGGGLLTGIALGWAMGYREKRRTHRGDRILSGVIAGVTFYFLSFYMIKGLALSFQ